MSKKLYKVILRGLKYTASHVKYFQSYVVADNSDDALRQVQMYLSQKNIGYPCDRELEIIELLAEASDSPNCGTLLYLN